MKVAAVQMVSGMRLADNLAQAKALLSQAAAAGAELVVLPEYFSAMGLQEHDKLAMAENFGEGPVQAFLAEMARALSLWIVGGTMPLACSSRDHVRNSSLVYAPTGECVHATTKFICFVLTGEVSTMTKVASLKRVTNLCSSACNRAMGRHGA